MKSIHVLPGSGDNFYCENCVRDNATVRALVQAREDVVAIPMYLPQIVDRVDLISNAPVFYGGINSYLQQVSGFFRWTPRWVDRLFDSRWMLKLAAKRAGSVRARGLGELTLSVMKGADGKQVKELDRLLKFLESVERPDVVHLSTPLLMGIGLAIRKRFGIPVVCTVHDEDVWIDAMEEPWRSRCWETMAEGGRDVAAFISVSRWYGEVMCERLKIAPAKMHVVPIGVDAGPEPSGAAPNPPALGYLARMAESMGLPLLVDAWLQLRKQERFKSLRLHLSGGRTGDDHDFLERLFRKIRDAGVGEGDLKLFDDFSPKGRREFLSTVSVLSVPTPGGAAFGTYILEAGAAGVPVVQPRVGSFPELIEATGGGLLCEPNSVDALAAALGGLLSDEARRSELGRRGRESVVRSFGLDTMARKMIDLYRSVVPAARAAEESRR